MLMQLGNTVLIVSGGGETEQQLGKVLNDGVVSAPLASACDEASKVVAESGVSCFFSPDASLPEGGGLEISGLANEGGQKISFIVLSSVLDIAPCLNALEAETCDFIAPPFYHRDITHLLKSAASKRLAIQSLGEA